MDNPSPIQLAKERAEDSLFAIPGVNAVGIGRKKKNGALTNELAIVVFLAHKKTLAELSEAERIPDNIEGFPTDVIEQPESRPLIKGGVQIEADSVGLVGTLSCFARTTDTPNRIVLLTNRHVLLPDGDSAELNKEVGQPQYCTICSRCCTDFVGRVLRSSTTFDPNIDAAIATLNSDVAWVPEIIDIGKIKGTYTLVDNDILAEYKVQKVGRTTNYTLGKVTHIHFSFRVKTNVKDPATDKAEKQMHGQMRIEALPPYQHFGEAGDSGSAIVNLDNKIVGLLHSGPEDSSYIVACPIAAVESQLQIHILTETDAPSGGSGGAAPFIAPFDGPLRGGGGIGRPNNDRIQLLMAQQDRARRTRSGQRFIEVFNRHLPEARRLVNENRDVASVWHRNRGPALINLFVRFIEDPSSYLPETISGRAYTECVRNLAEAFRRYGSPSLVADLEPCESLLLKAHGTNYPTFFRKMTRMR